MYPELHVNPHIYTKPFPRFDRPKIIGCIGLENLKFARQVHNTNKVRFDLNLLIDEAKHQPEDWVQYDFLQFLLKHEDSLNCPSETKLDSAKFFCYRGLMTCVCCTPYENKEAWKVVVILYKGCIYLFEKETEEKMRRRLNMTESEKRFTSWGYKFEQFVLSDKPDSEPNPNVPVDETEEFSLVFTTNLNRHSLVYAAEMDGIRCDTPMPPPPTIEEDYEVVVQYLSTKQFIELKTSRHIEFPNQERNFRRFKTKKWFCQSFLAGIDTVLCGHRNDDGIVEELTTYHIQELVKMSRCVANEVLYPKDSVILLTLCTDQILAGMRHLGAVAKFEADSGLRVGADTQCMKQKQFWNPDVCFNFLDTFFTYVKRCLAVEIDVKHGRGASMGNLQTLPVTALLLEWQPGMPVQATNDYVYEHDSIIPQWFFDNYGKIEK